MQLYDVLQQQPELSDGNLSDVGKSVLLSSGSAAGWNSRGQEATLLLMQGPDHVKEISGPGTLLTLDEMHLGCAFTFQSSYTKKTTNNNQTMFI